MNSNGQNQLSNSVAHEGLCTNCGKCCYTKIIVGRTVYITPFPCEFLDTATNLCTIYEKRHELNPLCLSIEEGLKHNAFPADCPYVDELAPPKYRPAKDEWDWAAEWAEFDELADDLEVSAEVREKVRLRGPHMPAMYVEAYERIKQQRASAANSPSGPSGQIWGENAHALVDMKPHDAAPSEGTPSLVNMARGAGNSNPPAATPVPVGLAT